MNKENLITTFVRDEFGAEHSNAIVSIWKIRKTSTDDFEFVDSEQGYVETSEFEGLTFRARFWVDAKAKSMGYPSRALNFRPNGPSGAATGVFVVDFDVDFENAINGAGTTIERVKAATALDFCKKMT